MLFAVFTTLHASATEPPTPQDQFVEDVLSAQHEDAWYKDLPGRPKYQLLSTFPVPTGITGRQKGDYEVGCVHIDDQGNLTVEAGFQWNGPSWIIDYGSLMKASLYHDALYRLMRARILLPEDARAKADALFARVAEDNDFPKCPARLSRYVLQGFGRIGARKKEGKTMCAPPATTSSAQPEPEATTVR